MRKLVQQNQVEALRERATMYGSPLQLLYSKTLVWGLFKGFAGDSFFF